MTTPTPDVPLRMEITCELPGTPEQVWQAIATGNGISSWFMPTDVEEGVGGTCVLHMGDDEMPAKITGWEPPHRFAYVEPSEWATVTGNDPSLVSEMASEFLVEAKSGGTCVLRVVSSAFGTGADWEREFFADMERSWRPYFDNLRLYLTHFPGQHVTPLSLSTTIPGRAKPVWAAIRHDLGAGAVGQAVDARGITGVVERVGADVDELLVRVTDPVPGFLGISAHDHGEGECLIFLAGYLFSEDAPAYIEREESAWTAWLEGLTVTTG